MGLAQRVLKITFTVLLLQKRMLNAPQLFIGWKK
jgi:hypothetical protein